MKNFLMLLAILGIVFWVANVGWNKHDQGECQYWSAIKEDPNFHPSKQMVDQCNFWNINIEKGIVQ